MIVRMITVLNNKIKIDHQCTPTFGVRSSGIPKDVCGEANRNLALLHLRVLLLPFTVLLQNKHTTLAENDENLISAQLRISAHSQGPNI